MNFLQLVKRFRQEVDIGGTGPVTVADQLGEMKRLVDWIAQAWIEIQLKKDDWQFLRTSMSFNTVSNQQSYDVETDISLTDFGSWRSDSFRIYLTADGSAGETFLSQYPYNDFRDLFLYGAQTTTYARPTSLAIAPDKALVFGLPPNDIYTVSGEYYATPVELASNGDTPAMPARHHMLIVYAAMMHYGVFEAASEVYQRGQEMYNLYLDKLLSDQAPHIGYGRSFI